MSSYYTRRQIVELLEIEEGFVLSLEREEIIEQDAPAGASGEFSERMLERARVAHNLVEDLDVNLAGAAIIVRLREEMGSLRQKFEELAKELQQLRRSAG